MKYINGEEVRLGDMVRLGDDPGGVVVCSIDSGDYSPEYPRSQWEYLKHGVIVVFPKYGVIHYEEPEPNLELVKRAMD